MDRGEIKKELGLTQEEMAMVLNVSLGRWKMYKSGQRGLPAAAMLKLSSLLQSVQKEKGISNEMARLLEEEQQRTNRQLKRDALKMELKLHRIQKEITILENNRAEALAALQTIAQLSKQEVPDEGLILIIRDRALKTLHKYNSYSLEQLQLKQRGFELMKAGIQQKIKLAGA